MWLDILDPDLFWVDELSKVNQEFLFGASTGILDGGYGERDGISEGHAYIVVAAHTLRSGKRLLKIRNPWAHARKGIWEGAWSDGSKEWTAEVQQELGHRFGGDSVFWISFEDFLRKYSHLDRTRLFREVDWRCSQSWISINVPWRACHQDRFRIILTKESPVVVAVSQLDRRYFNGLHGQYAFRLSFRIYHDADSGVRRYVAQSHDNSLMTRSASVELPKLIPGTYTICTRVDAERDTSLESVEDVIKQECRARTENVKLAQVGFAYDVAHKKAEAYISEASRLDKIKDRERASKCRREERRRRWEERHIQRVLTKKQKQKDKNKQRTRCKAQKEIDSASNKEPLTSAQTVAGPLTKNTNADVEGTRGCTLPGDVEKGTAQQEIIVQRHAEDGKVIRPCSCHERLVEEEGGSSAKPVSATMSSRDDEHLLGSSFRDSAGDSSDSPISEWEELYNTDDTTHSLEKESRDGPRRNTRCEHDVRKALVGESTDSDNSSEDETPSPWSAVCIVGVRVYSKDEALTLQTLFD
ncbi:Calpain-D [Fusarium oxysporum f. sp. raphani]|uniref:Calpain-D n=1 Tax=Fusarium oxysporum f. sp. raphani TaxID=96318 RepID=A0A8J5P8B0_FUSOX|nr:Calpain-D [Fusarium oxysporum f. sp. raphani]